MVAVYHSFAVFRIDGAERLWGMPIFEVTTTDAMIARAVTVLGNGGVAVTIFFVLSGVVLGLSLDQAKGPFGRQYGAFLVKRIFRIYPAHIATTLVVVLVLWLGTDFPESQSTTRWFGKWYDRPVDFKLVATNALLINTYLNPVTWTLLTEMIVALFFPFLYLISRRAGRVTNLLVLCALVMVPFFGAGGIIVPQICKFYVGLLIPLYGQLAVSWREGGSILARPYWVAAVCLLVGERALGIAATGGVLELIGATMVIADLLFGRTSRFWGNHLLRALGRHSYSFYLWHFPTMYLMVRLWTTGVADEVITAHPLLISALLCLASVIVANGLAFLSYELLETSFIHHGKHLSRRLFGDESRS